MMIKEGEFLWQMRKKVKVAGVCFTVEYSGIANIVTTSFTIHNAECTNIRQFGIRNDKVDVTLKAYSYYIDGTLTFTCIDKYEYNFNTQEWEYTAGSWAPTNVKLKR